jgi:hypothetical protein
MNIFYTCALEASYYWWIAAYSFEPSVIKNNGHKTEQDKTISN